MVNGHVVNTPCNGTVKYVLDKQNLVASTYFIKVRRCVLCGSCEFDSFCAELLPQNPPKPQNQNQKSEKPPQQPDNSDNEPSRIPSKPTLIQVKAFTGMPLGDMLIIKAGKKYIEVTTKKGQTLRFNRTTGLQTNCLNPKFANRVEPADIPKWIPFYQPFQSESEKQEAK